MQTNECCSPMIKILNGPELSVVRSWLVCNRDRQRLRKMQFFAFIFAVGPDRLGSWSNLLVALQSQIRAYHSEESEDGCSTYTCKANDLMYRHHSQDKVTYLPKFIIFLLLVLVNPSRIYSCEENFRTKKLTFDQHAIFVPHYPFFNAFASIIGEHCI